MSHGPGENPKTTYPLKEVITSLMREHTAGRVGGQFIAILQRAFQIQKPDELVAALERLRVKIEGGDGSSQEEAISITGDILGPYGILLEHIVIKHLRPGKTFNGKQLIENNEGTERFDVFSFPDDPDLWIDISQWWGLEKNDLH
ncbi:hypothetical protein KBD59_04535 [Candidatus Gracilibacteria bacterium]|nr:hypothetical protein [Candidatus Gracilibacteria bacterium]